jgi:hypothetical protein
MASASALRQLASAKLAYFKIMCLDPLVNNGSSKTGCTVRIIPCQQSSRTRCKWCECARASLLALPAEEYDWFDIHARTFRSIVDGTTVVRLYAKELVMHNFVGLPADQLLERMVELSLRTEEHL